MEDRAGVMHPAQRMAALNIGAQFPIQCKTKTKTTMVLSDFGSAKIT